MKQALLEALQALRENKRAAVLMTDMSGRWQALLDADLALVAGDEPPAEAVEAATRGLADDHSAVVEVAGERVFVQVFAPPLRMVLIGAVHIAQSLAPMASLVGYDVVVVDPRRAFAADHRFPNVAMHKVWPDDALRDLGPDHRTAIVTLTHDPKIDDPALIEALDGPAFYIGSLGSTRTHAARLERLRAKGVPEAALARIHAPVGLDIGAKTPAEIAVSVIAQVTAALHGRTGG